MSLEGWTALWENDQKRREKDDCLLWENDQKMREKDDCLLWENDQEWGRRTIVYCGKMTKNEGEGRLFTVGSEREDNGIDYTVALLIILTTCYHSNQVVGCLHHGYIGQMWNVTLS